MANSSEPWRRDGANSWNDLVRRVNEVLQNPPPDTDCDPIDPLPEVDECHQWTTQDITDMQDALKEACDTNVFTSVEECDKWTVSIIDEIEAAILVGFCDCETLNECAPPCDNQGPVEERFLLAEEVSGCLPVGEQFGSCIDQINARDALFTAYSTAKTAFITSFAEFCVLVEEVEDSQEELDDLTEQRDTECGANPGSPLCLSLTDQVEDKQTELDDKTAERDAKDLEQVIDRASLESAAADTVSNAQAAIQTPGAELSEIELVTGTTGVPWTNFECDDPLKIPGCFGAVNECEASWTLQRRSIDILRNIPTLIGFPIQECVCVPDTTLCEGGCSFQFRAAGSWTPDGNVVVRSWASCLGRPTLACSCSPSSEDCTFSCNSGCNGLFSAGLITLPNEWRLVITYPAEREAEACNTGEPCTPGSSPGDPVGGSGDAIIPAG